MGRQDARSGVSQRRRPPPDENNRKNPPRFPECGLSPWSRRRLVMLAIVNTRPGYRWTDPWFWGWRQWRIDVERAIKEGLIARTQKDGPRMRWSGRLPPKFLPESYPARLTNRGKHLKSLVLTDAGRSMLPAPAPQIKAEPYAKRRQAIAEFKEANRGADKSLANA